MMKELSSEEGWVCHIQLSHILAWDLAPQARYEFFERGKVPRVSSESD